MNNMLGESMNSMMNEQTLQIVIPILFFACMFGLLIWVALLPSHKDMDSRILGDSDPRVSAMRLLGPLGGAVENKGLTSHQREEYMMLPVAQVSPTPVLNKKE